MCAAAPAEVGAMAAGRGEAGGVSLREGWEEAARYLRQQRLSVTAPRALRGALWV